MEDEEIAAERPTTAGDTALMERVRDGDEQAFAELVERFQQELVGFFYHHCWDQLVAEDLAQTVFIKVFRARERWQSLASVRTWLYRIAHNVWVDHLRRLRPQISLDAPMGADGPSLGSTMAAVDSSRGMRDELIRARVKEASQHLSPAQQDVFILANNQEMRYEEISRILEIPVGTVKSRMHAAVRVLRQHLADLIEDT